MTTATPPLGWNSWDCFGGSVTEAETLANAEFMAEHFRTQSAPGPVGHGFTEHNLTTGEIEMLLTRAEQENSIERDGQRWKKKERKK